MKSRRLRIIAHGALVLCCVVGMSGVAHALERGTPVSPQETTVLQMIINRGDREIVRRLATLSKLTSKINASSKLTPADKNYLAGEVTGETTNLTALKTQLDAATTVAAARIAAQSIITDYRVYALIVPKILLISTADGQQLIESKLTALAGKLQTRLTAAAQSGKDVSALQAKLQDMNMQIQNASAISTSIEQKVLSLQPTDYNNDHTILSGDRAQLQTAHLDNVAAANDASAIVTGLKKR